MPRKMKSYIGCATLFTSCNDWFEGRINHKQQYCRRLFIVVACLFCFKNYGIRLLPLKSSGFYPTSLFGGVLLITDTVSVATTRNEPPVYSESLLVEHPPPHDRMTWSLSDQRLCYHSRSFVRTSDIHEWAFSATKDGHEWVILSQSIRSVTWIEQYPYNSFFTMGLENDANRRSFIDCYASSS